MKESLKNINNLSKLFIKENNFRLNIIDDETKKINKKSINFWIYIVLIIGIAYISNKIIYYVVGIGKPDIFLNLLLSFTALLIFIRTIMISMNVFYFSKDIENYLHLPLKSIEILVSKFNTILYMNYELELLVALIPLIIYGIHVYAGLSYFFNMIMILILFPIFIILVSSIIMISLMKTIKLFKNKTLMEFLISFIIILIVIFGLTKSLEYVFNNTEYISENQDIVLNMINEKIKIINRYFVIINPSADILLKSGFMIKIINYLKLLSYNLIVFCVFIIIGNKIYLKQLLKAKFYYKRKKRKTKIIAKKSSYRLSYIKKEFKLLIKNPIFLIQSIYPVIMITLMVCLFLYMLVPGFNDILHREENKELLEKMTFDFEAVCIIIGAVQVIGLFNYSSITSFSREGKNAYIIKVLPISLYKQIIYKNVPQIIINTIATLTVLATIKIQIPVIETKYIIIMFMLSLLLTIINSFILCLIDLLMPKLEWDAEYEILKNNRNKLFQYVLMIFNILFLIFANRVFNEHNFDKSLVVFGVVLFIFLIVFNRIIKKYNNKLFKKIN